MKYTKQQLVPGYFYTCTEENCIFPFVFKEFIKQDIDRIKVYALLTDTKEFRGENSLLYITNRTIRDCTWEELDLLTSKIRENGIVIPQNNFYEIY